MVSYNIKTYDNLVHKLFDTPSYMYNESKEEKKTLLTRKAPNTTIADFANTVDTNEIAHNEPSHLDLQCLPTSLSFFNIIQFILKVFQNFADVILLSAFLALYELMQNFVCCLCRHFICSSPYQQSIFSRIV